MYGIEFVFFNKKGKIMNFQYGHIHIVYLGLSIFSLVTAISGFVILKNNLKTKKVDVLNLYGSIFVVLAAVIVFLYSVLHIVAHP